MSSIPPRNEEDEQPEAELDDEQLDTVTGGTLTKSSRVSRGAAAPDQAATLTAIALAESGGNDS